MATSANRHNIIPELERVSLVVMVMRRWLTAHIAWALRCPRHSPVSNPLGHQSANSDFFLAGIKCLGVSPFRYLGPLPRVEPRPFRCLGQRLGAEVRVSRPSGLTVGRVVYPGALKANRSLPVKSFWMQSKITYFLFGKALCAGLSCHIQDITMRIGICKHFQATAP